MKPNQETNEKIAKFLGWFKEEGQPETWFHILDNAKYVAYSEYNDRLRELPFHKSWSDLMPVLAKIKATKFEGHYVEYMMNGESMSLQVRNSNNGSVLLGLYSFYDKTLIGKEYYDHVYSIVVKFIEWYQGRYAKS